MEKEKKIEKESKESAMQERLRALEAALEAETKRRAALESENDALKQENWELRIDPRTGLERERRYYETVNSKIEQIIKERGLGALLLKDSLSDEDLRLLDEIPLSATAADLGYLSKYNEDPEITKYYGEHVGGDTILQETGAIIQKADRSKRDLVPKLDAETRGYRVGGDEFAMVHDKTKDAAKQVVLEFALKQEEIKIKGADLPPVINCGTASLREAVEAFIAAVPSSERQELGEQMAAKKIQELLTSIADRRAKVAKGIERLTTMAKLMAEDPEKFRRNHRWLQKGAFGMVEQEFGELVALISSPEEMRKAVQALVKEKLEVEQSQEEDRRLKERAVIVDISDRDFF